MPRSVTVGGGPASPSQESKYPGRGDSTFTSFPLVSSSGVHSARLSDVAMRISGTLKYIQYFNVPDILIATSDNLADWTPLEDTNGKLVKVLSPRPGYFDSWLVEAGPPAIVTERGILVLYNAGNSERYGDPGLPHRIYTGGQALYDPR